MPNLDGGHYFLTVLAPVRLESMRDSSRSLRSPGHLLAETLALLPTGQQTVESLPEAEPSPFARNRLNHMARFVIIDQPAFNGRLSGDSLLNALFVHDDPLVGQPVDRLTNPYLLFAADIDAPGDGEAALRAYTDALWETMRSELDAIFTHCLGYTDMTSPAAFFDFVKKCQVETTMPFNDYWPNQLEQAPATFPIIPLLAGFVITLLVFECWLLLAIHAPFLVFVGAHGAVAHWVWGLAALGLLIVPALVWMLFTFAYRALREAAGRPFPTSEGASLPVVLKALFLQQRFTSFAISAQGLDAAALHSAFGTFLSQTVPAETDPAKGPTQMPGFIKS